MGWSALGPLSSFENIFGFLFLFLFFFLLHGEIFVNKCFAFIFSGIKYH